MQKVRQRRIGITIMNRENFFSGFVWKFLEQIISQIVSFTISIVLARLLTPHDYGVVALVNVFIVIAGVFVTSGFSTSLIQKKDADELDFSTIFYCSLALACIIYLILFVSAPFIADFYHNMQLSLVVRVFGLTLPILAVNSIQQAQVARHLAFKKIFFSTTVATVVSGIFGIAFALMDFGVWALVFQYLISNIASMFVLFIQISWRPKLMFSLKRAKSLMSYGWKVMAADFLGTFFAQLRSLVIGRFYAPSALAFYNRGQQLPNLLSNNIDTTISSVLFPYMSQAADDPKKMKEIVRRSLRISSYIIMPLMLGLMVTSKPIIILLLTSKWINAVPYMQWLCVASALSTITNTNLQVMRASGRSDILLKIELIKKPVYLLLLLISIKISVIAVAITMTIYSFYAAIVNIRPNQRIIGYSYGEQLREIAPSLILSIVMAIVIWPISLLTLPAFGTLIIQIICGATFYLLCSYLLRFEAFKYLNGFLITKIKGTNEVDKNESGLS